MAIKLKENKTIKDPYDGTINTAIGKADAIINRSDKKATIIVKIWRDENSMNNKSQPIIIDTWEVSGKWFDDYFNVNNTYTDNPSQLIAHCAYLVVHDYYETRFNYETQLPEDVYRYGDWEPYIV